MSGSSIARDVRDSASMLYEEIHAKIGKNQCVYGFTLFAGPAALEGEAATRIPESKQRSYRRLALPVQLYPSGDRAAQISVPPISSRERPRVGNGRDINKRDAGTRRPKKAGTTATRRYQLHGEPHRVCVPVYV